MVGHHGLDDRVPVGAVAVVERRHRLHGGVLEVDLGLVRLGWRGLLGRVIRRFGLGRRRLGLGLHFGVGLGRRRLGLGLDAGLARLADLAPGAELRPELGLDLLALGLVQLVLARRQLVLIARDGLGGVEVTQLLGRRLGIGFDVRRRGVRWLLLGRLLIRLGVLRFRLARLRGCRIDRFGLGFGRLRRRFGLLGLRLTR
ncbi:MAG: hypothetical protein U5J98_11855 [Halobacteriales archaeon]|nr:hypothetical protein [Halobacteriales archaeon]